jgi:hypothetical protein
MENLTITDRNERLNAVNAALAARGLSAMPKLGDQTKGEIEILSIKEIHDFASRFFTYVKFAVAFPGGKEGEFSVRFNANGAVCDGAVIVVMVNNRFAIVKQWRLPLGRWTYETARGFSEKLDSAYRADDVTALGLVDLPIGTVLRELDEEVMKNAKLKGIFHLGDVAENSGTNAVVPSYFLVQIEVADDAALGGSEEHLKVLLWDAQKVADELGGKICDSHSITAFALARKKLATLGQL